MITDLLRKEKQRRYAHLNKGYVEHTAQCVERKEDNPENWPTLSELPEADTSDLVQAYRYQSTIDADFDS